MALGQNIALMMVNKCVKFYKAGLYNKQEAHDGPKVAHLRNIGPKRWPIKDKQGF